MGYRGYGLPIGEVVSEGKSAYAGHQRFDPDKGFRLATSAMWVIRAAIQDTPAIVVAREDGHHRQPEELFFNLRKAKGRISALEEATSARPGAADRHPFRRHRRQDVVEHEHAASAATSRSTPRCARRAKAASGRIGWSTTAPARKACCAAQQGARTASPLCATRSACSTRASGASSRRAASPTIRSHWRSCRPSSACRASEPCARSRSGLRRDPGGGARKPRSPRGARAEVPA